MSSFQQKKVPAKNVEEVDALVAPIPLDVREPDEWEAGHAPDAWFWPLARLDQVRAELPHGTTIVCVCRSGARSAKATDLLLSWGLFADLVLMPAILAGPMGRFFTHGIKIQPKEAPAEETAMAASDV